MADKNFGQLPDDGQLQSGDIIAVDRGPAGSEQTYQVIYVPPSPGGAAYTDEQVRDVVAALLVEGTNITLTYDDAANTLTIDSTGGTGGGLTAEQVRDTVASFIRAGSGSGITVTHDDSANTLTLGFTLPDGSVTPAKLDADNAAKQEAFRNAIAVPAIPTGPEIGEQAFDNVPTDLEDAEKQDVLAAIGASSAFSGASLANQVLTLARLSGENPAQVNLSGIAGDGGGDGDGIERSIFWWEENGPAQASSNAGRQWSLGNGATGQPIRVPADYEVESLAVTFGATSATQIGNATIAETTVRIETIPEDDSQSGAGTDVTDLEVTLPAAANAQFYTAVFTPDDASPITIPAGSLIRPYTTTPASASNHNLTTGGVAAILTLALKRSIGSGGGTAPGAAPPGRVERITMQAVASAATSAEAQPITSSPISIEYGSGDAEILSGVSGNDFTVAAGLYIVDIEGEITGTANNSGIGIEIRDASDDSVLANSSRPRIFGTVSHASIKAALWLGADTAVNLYYMRRNNVAIAANWTVDFIRVGGPAEEAPAVHPHVSGFSITSGDTSPLAGDIAGDYNVEWSISQSSHVSAARIIGFAGTGANPSSVSVLRTLTAGEYHGGAGSITAPSHVLAADETYTFRLEAYESGQTPGTDAPTSYADARITAHAPAAALYHWGRVQRVENQDAATYAAAINFANDDLVTGNVLATTHGYNATPGASGGWVFYLAAAASAVQPTGWTTGGLPASSVFQDAVDQTINSVAYKIYVMRDLYYRDSVDGPEEYTPTTS